MIGRLTGETPVPGKTMGPIAVVERDYAADRGASGPTLGPLVEKLGVTTKGVTTPSDAEVEELAAKHGVIDSGAAAGRPAIDTAEKMADTILALSGTSNGRLAVEGFKELEKRTGQAADTFGRRAARNAASLSRTPRPGLCR